MPLSSVIERELRIQARTRATYGLRGRGALRAVGALVWCFFTMKRGIFEEPRKGPWLFALLHTGICLFFAGTCPFMVADTLARERREGTLGILLLTPLRPAS